MILDPSKTVTLVGSCFSENIGGMMGETGWPVKINPCGILYNPASISQIVRLAFASPGERVRVLADSLSMRGGIWSSWLFSSKFSSSSSRQTFLNALCGLDAMKEALLHSDAVIFTFGTSRVYFRDGRVVSNCHKYPEKEFDRRLLSVEESVAEINDLVNCLRANAGDIKIIFTVSPVRHLRDGFAGNSLSKATLLLAVDQVMRGHSDFSNGPLYFPAFEILNDDLRDYRFYADDLLHPSRAGIEYIWEKFQETFLLPAGLQKIEIGRKEHHRSSHRPIVGS